LQASGEGGEQREKKEAELAELRARLLRAEEVTHSLERDLAAMSQLAGESTGSLTTTQDSLVQVSCASFIESFIYLTIISLIVSPFFTSVQQSSIKPSNDLVPVIQ